MKHPGGYPLLTQKFLRNFQKSLDKWGPLCYTIIVPRGKAPSPRNYIGGYEVAPREYQIMHRIDFRCFLKFLSGFKMKSDKKNLKNPLTNFQTCAIIQIQSRKKTTLGAEPIKRRK